MNWKNILQLLVYSFFLALMVLLVGFETHHRGTVECYIQAVVSALLALAAGRYLFGIADARNVARGRIVGIAVALALAGANALWPSLAAGRLWSMLVGLFLLALLILAFSSRHERKPA